MLQERNHKILHYRTKINNIILRSFLKHREKCSLTCTLGVRTLAGQVQVAQQIWGQVTREVGDIPALYGSSCQLQQRGGVVGHLFDEAHHQRVASEAELLQMDQTQDLPRQVSEQVVVETQRSQRVESNTTQGGTRAQLQTPTILGTCHRNLWCNPCRKGHTAGWVLVLPGQLWRHTLDTIIT